MIKIITREPSGVKVIRDVDMYFEMYISARDFTSMDKQVIYDIDSATLLDVNVGTVKTPYGVTTIQYLSTGCKIVLFYLYTQKTQGKSDFKDCILEITECGGNALKVLFKYVEELGDDKSIFLLRQATQIMELHDFSGIVDGNECKSLYKGLKLYGKWV